MSTITMTETEIDKWHCYFESAKGSNLLAVFDSLVALGMRPVPIGEDSTGAIKIPIGSDWGLTDNKSRRKLLARHVKQQVPVGIGVQADGHVVLDIDPPNKDRMRLGEAWKEAAALLLGGEDWPDTLTVKTKAGCHVWFKINDQVREAWQNHGKLKMSLPCGGAVEFFTGNNKQMQVATAPSEGKAIAREIIPAEMPSSLESAILDLLKPEPETKPVTITNNTPATTEDETWFMDRLEKLTVKTLNAEAGSRHDTYRASVRTIAGYAAGMNLLDKFEVVYNHLASAHKDAKPEVSDYVLTATYKWAWAKGIEKKLDRPRPSIKEEEASEFLGEEDTMEAANAADIIALMSERKFLWGDNEKKIGWLQLGGVHLVEGREGTGKTRFMMDVVKRWSLDQYWPDGTKTTIDPDSKVLFVASDSHWDQVAMIAQDFGVPFENVLFAGPKTSPYDYTSIDEKATIEIIRIWCRKYKIAMIVIDTLMSSTSRPLVDRQECAIIANPLRAIAREFNLAVVMIGHLNAQGKTYGLAMQGNCENVIRLEANEIDPQNVTIKSEKCRWNRFALPIIEGRQHDTGWEYTCRGSDQGEEKQVKGRAGASAAIRNYLMTVSRAAWGEIIDELEEAKYAKTTVNRALKVMVETGEIVSYKEKFPSGKECSFYELNPQFDSDQSADLVPVPQS